MLDVYCSGVIEEYIKLRSVKRLKTTKKPRGAPRTWWTTPGNHDDTDWLTPKVYKGLSDGQAAVEEPDEPGPPPAAPWFIPPLFTGTSDREHGLLTWIRKLFS